MPLTDVMPEVDAVIANDIAQWLTIGKVTSAVVGEVVDVELGPAVLAPLAPGPGLSVSTTAVINIRVTESFIGDAKPGEVVQVLIDAGPGRVVAPGEPPPFRPVEGAGISIAEFNEALPTGVQVIAMSNLHPPEQLGGSEALPAIFPPGLEPRQTYMTAVHPQALVVNPVDSESNWSPHTFDELVQQLREAT